MTLVSMPRVDLTRYHGVFAPNSTSRAPITPARRGQRNSEPADKAPTALLLTPLGTDPEWFMTPADTRRAAAKPTSKTPRTLHCHSRFRPSIRSPTG
jgi:hypothetical protein